MLEPDLRAARLRNLLLMGHDHRSAVDVVTWLGALQAQDLASAMWSIGVRMPGSTEAAVASAFEDAQILRTWPMRGTIHVVPAADAAWMLDVTARRAMNASLRQRELLGFSVADADRAVAVLETALAGGVRLTRAQALAAIDGAGIDTSGQRGYHLLLYASQIGVTCIGPQVGSEQTFVLLSEWVPAPRRMSRDEGLVELAFRYFRSHGPTTVRDFAGWTGLTLTESRAAVAANDGRLIPIGEGQEALWTGVEPPAGLPETRPGVLALPGFDELVLGYKDRRLHVPEGMLDRIVPGGNGVFRATIVVAGVVVGTWRRTLRPGRVDIVVEPFSPLSGRTTTAATKALTAYADFLGRTPSVTIR